MISGLITLLITYTSLEPGTGDVIAPAATTGIASAVAGSSVAYSRRLYKAILDGRVNDAAPKELVALAATVYFLARPVFSAIFALVLLAGGLAGLTAISTNSLTLGPGLVHLMAFSGFFFGFAAGHVLGRLEAHGNELLGRWLP
jgi:hypothetical protein